MERLKTRVCGECRLLTLKCGDNGASLLVCETCLRGGALAGKDARLDEETGSPRGRPAGLTQWHAAEALQEACEAHYELRDERVTSTSGCDVDCVCVVCALLLELAAILSSFRSAGRRVAAVAHSEADERELRDVHAEVGQRLEPDGVEAGAGSACGGGAVERAVDGHAEHTDLDVRLKHVPLGHSFSCLAPRW